MLAVDETRSLLRRDERARPTRVWPSGDRGTGEVSLSGEILDPECWSGAMRPSDALHLQLVLFAVHPRWHSAGVLRTRPHRPVRLMIMTTAGAPMVRSCWPGGGPGADP